MGQLEDDEKGSENGSGVFSKADEATSCTLPRAPIGAGVVISNIVDFKGKVCFGVVRRHASRR